MKKSKYILLFLYFIFFTLNIYSVDYYARTNGNWSSPSTWISTSWTADYPGPGDNVYIDGYQITVNISNAQCAHLELKSDSRNANASLTIPSGKSLRVTGDVLVSSPSNRDKNIDLYVYGDLNISGNLQFDRASNNTRQRRLRLYVDGGRVDIKRNLIYNYRNASTWETSSNEIELRNGGGISCDNVNISKKTGGGFKIYTNGGSSSNPNVWVVSGNFTIEDLAGNRFELDLRGYTNLNVNGYFKARLSNDYQSYFYLRNNSSISANNIDIDKEDGDNFRFILYDNSTVTTNGDFDINITNFDGNWMHTYITLQNNARIDVGSNFSVVQNHNSQNNLRLQMSDNAILSCGTSTTGNFIFENLHGNQTEISLRDNSQVNISGNAIITHNSTYSNENFRLRDNSSFSVQGDVTFDYTCTNDWQDFYFYIDNSATFSSADLTVINDSPLNNIRTYFYVNRDASATINGNLDINHSSLRELRFYINTDDASSTGVNFTVTGDLTIDNNGTGNSAGTYVRIDRDAQVSIGGDFYINHHNSGGEFFVDVNPDAGITTHQVDLQVGGDFTMYASNVRDMRFRTQNNATVNIGGDVEIQASGYATTWGDMNIRFNDNSNVTINGNFTADKTEGAEFNFRTEDNAQFLCKGEAKFGYSNASEDWAGFLFRFLDNSMCTIQGKTRIYNTSTLLHNPTILRVDNNAVFTVGKNDATHSYNLHMRHNSMEEFTVDCRSNAVMNVYGEFNFEKQNNDPYTDGKIELRDNARINVYDNLVLNNSNNDRSVYVRLRDDNCVLNVRGNIDMTSALASNRVYIRLDNASKLHIGGSFLRNATPNKYGKLDARNTSTVYYDGDGTFGQQVIAENYGDGTDGFTYQNIVINNTSSSVPQLTMEGIVEVLAGRNVSFLDGIVEATASKYFRILDDATVSDASDNSYVQGFVHKVGDDAFTYPVGNTDNDDGNTRYAPLTLTPYSYGIAPSNNTEFAVYYANINPNAVGDTSQLDPSLNHVSREEYWLINKIYANSGWNVTLSWKFPRSGHIDNTSEIRIAHWNGSLWENYGNDGTTGNVNSGTITVNNVTNFSPFTLASITDLNPLPVELVYFYGKQNAQNVDLYWQTATEINNDYFTVERSADGVNFVPLGYVEGKGNYNAISNYKFTDYHPYSGVNYYRLKQTDFDGKYRYSNIISVYFLSTEETQSVEIYPNPVVSSTLNLTLKGFTPKQNVSILIKNTKGQSVFAKEYKVDSFGNTRIKIDVDALNAGLYFISIYDKSSGKLLTEKFIVK